MVDRCPEIEVLSAYLGGFLDPKEQSLVEAHLGECENCRRVVTLALRSEDQATDPDTPDPADS